MPPSYCAALLITSRIGYFWLAIREDEEAARAAGIDTFRYKMYAVTISAAVTSFAGVFYAFFYNNLFPEQVFNISQSIQIILGPIIGGVGTLFGPILGAFVLTGLAESLNSRLDRDGPRSARRGTGVLRRVPPCRRRGAARGHLAVACAAARRQGCAVMTALLSLTAVSKRFRGLLAVDRVSFDVAEGAVFAVIGPNGAGKTTLFNMIAGATRPDDGAIVFAGAPIGGLSAGCRLPARHRPHLPAGAAVSGAERRGQCRRRRAVAPPQRRRGARPRPGAAAPARSVRLSGDQRAATLTLPDRKRLEVARALATGPRLLLLDEVMAGLRPTETDRMVATLRDLNRDTGVTILLIEHVMRAVMALASRVLVLDHGVAIAEGTPQAIVRDPGGGAVLSRRGDGVMLAVENLDVFYGDVQALDGVSLEIAEGAIVAIVGANGAGKTTLIRALAGMQRRLRGRITFRGTDISGWPSHRVCNLGIGQVAEGRQVFPTLSVEENLDVGAMLPRARAARAKNRDRAFALFPRLAERARPAGRYAVGRRAANARHRPLPDGRAATHHVRRAVARPGAGDRAQRARYHRRSQPRRHHLRAWSSRTWRCRSSLRAALMCWKTAASR